ncbi:MAG: hypothetical protein RL268_1344 [Pseudomonadota bacterium]
MFDRAPLCEPQLPGLRYFLRPKHRTSQLPSDRSCGVGILAKVRCD